MTRLAPESDAVIIVDVLSFSTCVAIAVANGAVIYPYQWKDESARVYAAQLGAFAAMGREGAAGDYTLSPASLLQVPAGTKLVLPSPNGSTLSLLTGNVPTFAGCLRNASAVAVAARQYGRRISVIAAGERWSDGSLRPAIEDLIGAGAIIHQLEGARSPEAEIARQAFLAMKASLEDTLLGCVSGKELIARGFSQDVALAAELDAHAIAPLLRDGAYVQF